MSEEIAGTHGDTVPVAAAPPELAARPNPPVGVAAAAAAGAAPVPVPVHVPEPVAAAIPQVAPTPAVAPVAAVPQPPPPTVPLPHPAMPLPANGVPPIVPPPPAAAAAAAAPAPLAAKAPATAGGGAQAVHPTCFPPLEEFAEDIELRLGRANGNIFHRRTGIEGVHDGQIMVRLKKKRFIVIDYGIMPTAADVAAAAVNPNVACPAGAGKQKCVTAECPKRGVPVLLYDSDPSEPASLYLRSGLCFTCQRILNEKRRTQRKRKSDAVAPTVADHHGGDQHPHLHHVHHHGAAGPGMHPHGDPHGQGAAPVPAAGAEPPGFHHLDPTAAAAAKRFRLNGEIVDLSPDAIIINGPLDGTKHHGPGYGFEEIGADLLSIVAGAAKATERLVSGTAPSQHVPASPAQPAGVGDAAAVAAAGQNDDAVAVAAAAAAAAAVAAVGQAGAVEAATAAAVEATATTPAAKEPASAAAAPAAAAKSAPAQPQAPPTGEEIPALYERAFLSLSRAIYLLSQWKASRDAHDAEELARKAALEVPHIPLSSVSDHGGLAVNADAVAAAAAAAVASASAAPPPPPPPAIPAAVEAAAMAAAVPVAPLAATAPVAAVPVAPLAAAAPVAAPVAPAAVPVAAPDAAVEVAATAIKAGVPSQAFQDASAATAAGSAALAPTNGVTDGGPSCMIPLLLAAEGRKDNSTPKVKEENANGAAVAVQLAEPQEQPQAVAAALPAGDEGLDSAAVVADVTAPAAESTGAANAQ